MQKRHFQISTRFIDHYMFKAHDTAFVSLNWRLTVKKIYPFFASGGGKMPLAAVMSNM